MEQSRLDILLKTASDPAAACANDSGRCASVYESILNHHGVDSFGFRHSFFETLAHGRRKGNAMLLVGGKDTGNMTVAEPAAHIFPKHGHTPIGFLLPLAGFARL